jgi:hypothetical protein
MVNVIAVETPESGFVTDTAALPEATMSGAGTTEVSWVEFTKVVESGAPFHLTTDPAEKAVPFTVNVNAAPPAAADDGLRETMPGRASTLSRSAPDATAPGFTTVIFNEAGAAVACRGMLAVSSVALTNVVGAGDPFQQMAAPFSKPTPFTVRVNAAEFAGTADGLIPLRVGDTAPMAPLKI